MRWNMKQLKKFVTAINYYLEGDDRDFKFNVYEVNNQFTLNKVFKKEDKQKPVISGTARTLGFYLMGYFDQMMIDSTNPMENSIDLFWEKGNPYEMEAA